MGETRNCSFGGTVAQLREWLDQFNDNDIIEFDGGNDSGSEFFDIYVNGQTVYSV